MNIFTKIEVYILTSSLWCAGEGEGAEDVERRAAAGGSGGGGGGGGGAVEGGGGGGGLGQMAGVMIAFPGSFSANRV